MQKNGNEVVQVRYFKRSVIKRKRQRDEGGVSESEMNDVVEICQLIYMCPQWLWVIEVSLDDDEAVMKR